MPGFRLYAVKINRRLARKLYRIRHKYTEEDLRPEFDGWLEWVTRIAEGVTLHPGGRATIQEAVYLGDLGSEGSVPIDLWWQPWRDGLPAIIAFRVEAHPGTALAPWHREYQWDVLHVGEYWAALALRLGSHEDAPAEANRPAPGKKPSLDHYRGVLAAYDNLVKQRHPSPVSELADRYAVRPGTIKSWLHRGRKYLGGES